MKITFLIDANEAKLIGFTLHNDLVMLHRLKINELIKKDLIRDLHIVRSIFSKSEVKQCSGKTEISAPSATVKVSLSGGNQMGTETLSPSSNAVTMASVGA